MNFSTNEKLPYEQFQATFKKWHTKIAAVCLKWLKVGVKETHCTTNVLTMLSRLLPVYPSTYPVFKALKKKCTELVKREKGPSGTGRTALGLLADQYQCKLVGLRIKPPEGAMYFFVFFTFFVFFFVLLLVAFANTTPSLHNA